MNEQGIEEHPTTIDDQVVDYLQQHPDFFIHHAQLLDQLRLPHPESGQAISLIERQLSRLREQNRHLEERIGKLTRAAQTNEQLLQRLQHLSHDLIRCRRVDETLESVDRLLRSDFHADAVAIHLFTGLQEGDHELTLFSAGEEGKPYTGPLSEAQLSLLFGDDHHDIASVVTIPLTRGNDQRIGLLAIGSIDPKRFEPAMGTEFVAHLGNFIGELIAQQLDNPDG